MASNRVYKTIPKGQGKAPTKVVRRREGLKAKDPEVMFQRRMEAIKRISGGMGENLKPGTKAPKAKKRPSIEDRKTIPYGATGAVIRHIFGEDRPADKIFEDIEGM
jgi:hypothetical protein